MKRLVALVCVVVLALVGVIVVRKALAGTPAPTVASTCSTAPGTTSTSQTINCTVSTGQVVIVSVFIHVGGGNGEQTITPPAGFTSFNDSYDGPGGQELVSYWHYVGAGDTGSYSFSWPLAEYSHLTGWVINGADTGAPVDANAGNSANSSATLTTLTVTPTTGNTDLPLAAFGNSNNSSAPSAITSGWTQDYAGNTGGIYLNAQHGPGVTGATSATITYTTSPGSGIVGMIALINPPTSTTVKTVGNNSDCGNNSGYTCGNGSGANAVGNGSYTCVQGNGHNGELFSLGNCGGSVSNPGTHVHDAGYGWGYNGISTSVSIATQALWLDYAYQGANNSQYQAGGIKTLSYTNFWAFYPSDNPRTGYYEIAPVATCQANAAGGADWPAYNASNCTGTYVSQEATNCSGTPLVDNHYGGGYINAPYISTANFANLAHDRTGVVAENYVFSDDTGVNFDFSPCNNSGAYSASVWITQSTAAMAAVTTAKVGAPIFANVLCGEDTGNTPVTSAAIVNNAATEVGAMCENAFISGGGATGGSFQNLTTWEQQQDGCLAVIAAAKICWIYSNLGAVVPSVQNDAQQRLYAFGSFLLSYDDPDSIFEYSITGLTSNMPVMPEEELVPTSPVNSATGNDITTLASGGGFLRKWNHCFYDGVDKGVCAVAVNPNSSGNMTVSTTGYTHAMSISTGTANSDIVDGGTVSLTGAPSGTVAPQTAEILLQ